jgi:hypothetical protein
MTCPICLNKDLKVEINSFDNQYFIRCCSICLSNQETEEAAIKEWNSMKCWGEAERLKGMLKQIFESYIVTRMENSGSLGNLPIQRRREVIIHEILTELKWAPNSF